LPGRTREEEDIERAIALSMQETKLNTSEFDSRPVDFFHYNGLHPPGLLFCLSSFDHHDDLILEHDKHALTHISVTPHILQLQMGCLSESSSFMCFSEAMVAASASTRASIPHIRSQRRRKTKHARSRYSSWWIVYRSQSSPSVF
jgi:hypothetical protein